MSDAVLFLCPRCTTGRRLPPYAVERRIRCLKCRSSSRSDGNLYDAARWEQQTDFNTLCAISRALGRAPSARQWRLLACAIARTEFEWLRNPWFRDALSGAERWADTGTPPRDVENCRRQLQRLDLSERDVGRDPYEWFHRPEDIEQSRQARRLPYGWVFLALRALSDDPQPRAADLTRDTRPLAGSLLRELVPNPFVPVAWNADWFTTTARDLAGHVSAKGDFGAMPILADALQDAGCEDRRVLSHCREGKQHARGCWVLDAVLGKL